MNTKKIVCQGWKRINKVTVPSMVTGFLAQMSIASAEMPWEGPLSEIQASVTGPVATGVCTIIVVITGIAISCGEGGGAGRRLLQGICGLALALGVASFISSFN